MRAGGLGRLTDLREELRHFEAKSFVKFWCMMAPYSDPRKMPGAVVHAKARAVTNEKLCQRLHGSNWKVKVVPGAAVSVTEGAHGTRQQSSVTAEWEIESVIKRAAVKIGNVKIGPVPDTTAAAITTPDGSPPGPQISQQPSYSPSPEIPAPEPLFPNGGNIQSNPCMSPHMDMNTEVLGFHWTAAKTDMHLNKTVETREWKVKYVIDAAIEGQFMDRLTP